MATATVPALLFSIDGPFDDQRRLLYYGSSIIAKGWANLPDERRTLRVYYEDQELGIIQASEERPDVQRIYPGTPLASGFTCEISLDRIPESDRSSAKVRFQLEQDGEPLEASVFPLAQTEPQCILHIDSVIIKNSRIVVTTTNTTLVGWCVGQAEIVRMSARIGADLVFPVHYGIARPDVLASHRSNPNGFHTGFSLFLPELPEGDLDIVFEISTTTNHLIRKSYALHAARGHSPTPPQSRPASEARFWSLAAKQRDPLDWIIVIGGERAASDARQTVQVNNILSLCSQADHRMIAYLPAKLRSRADVSGPARFYDSTAHLKTLLSKHKQCFVSCLSPTDTIDASAYAAIRTSVDSTSSLVYWDERISRGDSHSFSRKTPGAPFLTEFYQAGLGRGCAVRVTDALLTDLGDGHSLSRAIAAAALLCFYETPETCIHIPAFLTGHSYEKGSGSVDAVDLELRSDILTRLNTCFGRFHFRMPEKGAPADARPVPRLVMSTRSPPLVSIIIPTIGARGRILKCLQDLRERSSYKPIEVIVLDHTQPNHDTLATRRAIREGADKVLPVSGAFNWSRFNNMGAMISRGEVLLFLNDDIEVVSQDWIEELVCLLNFDRVGAAGPRLLLPDGNGVQSSGVSLLSEEGWARNDFAFSGRDTPLADGVNLKPRNCTSLLGAAVAVRREVFLNLGGFNEDLPLTFNDLDFHLKLREAGYQVVITPFAELVHHEKTSRAELTESPMEEAYWKRWQHVHRLGDPYWHPARETTSGLYKVDPEPVEPVWHAGIIGQHSDVQRILALRLDHIGDFVLTLPAFHRLRKLFPQARIEVVVGKWNIDLAKQSGLFAAIHQLDLYNERSGDGRASSIDEAKDQLAQMLRDSSYDLAIDFRADGDTRPLLQSIPAKFRAGFSHGIRYPWLDVSVEWEGNQPRWRQTANGSVKLQRLVSAVAAAYPLSNAEQALWPASILAAERSAARDKQAPLVVLHPFAGNAIKMWSPLHWVILATTIIQAGGRVALVGTEGDRKTYADLVADMVAAGAEDRLGSYSLTELLRYLAGADCFVGVDSGPKHLAASTRIPTIGIQSGFVDPVIWGPACDQGISLIKRVTCSPCYFDSITQCDRGHACMRAIMPRDVYRYVSIVTGLKYPGADRPARNRQPASARAGTPAAPLALPAE